MSNLVVFQGSKNSDIDNDELLLNEEDRQHIVSVLEHWLEEAKAGKIIELGIAAETYEGNSVHQISCGDPNTGLLAAVNLLQVDIQMHLFARSNDGAL